MQCGWGTFLEERLLAGEAILMACRGFPRGSGTPCIRPKVRSYVLCPELLRPQHRHLLSKMTKAILDAAYGPFGPERKLVSLLGADVFSQMDRGVHS